VSESSGSTPAGRRGPLVFRPHRIAIYGAIGAIAVLTTMIVVGVLLRSSSDGVMFRTADQVGLIGVGVLGAGAIMLVARPRLRADDDGLRVRNVLGEKFFPWREVLRVAFPPGAHWARLLLADDETYPVLAIQAMDTQRAVDALAAVREMHRAHASSTSEQSAHALEQARRREQAEAAAAASRPLGRLEIIDREKAAQGPKRRRRRG
jgi:hypothetical protein